MKINVPHIIVKNGWEHYHCPEYILMRPSSREDGVYISERLADEPEKKIITKDVILDGTSVSVGKFVEMTIKQLPNMEFVDVVFPKMTKAGAIALLEYPSLFVMSNGKWIFSGFGVSNIILEHLEQSNYFRVSSGVIAPLMTGETLSLKLLKNRLVIVKASDDSILIFNTIKEEKK